MFEDPKKGAESFAKSTHDLTLAEYDLIVAMQEQGRQGEAQLLLGEKLSTWTNKHKEEVGLLAFTYRWWKSAISEADTELGKILMGTHSLQEVIAAQERSIESSRKLGIDPGVIKMAEEKLELLKGELAILGIQTKEREEQSKLNDADLANRKLVAASDQGRLATLQNQMKAIADTVRIGADADVAMQASVTVQKQIDELMDRMGTKGRQRAQEQIELQSRLNEISIAAAQKANDHELKMGAITKERHDQNKLDLDLRKNGIEQVKEAELAAISSVISGERRKHQLKLQELVAEAEAIKLQGGYATDEEKKKSLDDALKKQQELDKHELDALDKKIAAQQLYNAEIGKTQAQKDIEKQLVEESGTRELEIQAEAFRNVVALNILSADELKIYQEKLTTLDAEIEKRKVLATLLGQASVLQKQADGIKETKASWKRLTDDVERSLTDALMHGFDKGKGFLQSFTDSIKNSLKSSIISIGVRAVVSPIMGAIGSALGIAGDAASGGGGGMSGTSMLSLGSSAYSLAGGSSLYSSFAMSGMGQALGLSTAGSMIAPAAGTIVSGAAGSIPTVFAANMGTVIGGTAEAVGTTAAAGSMTALGSAIPYVGAAIAIASALGLFGGGNDNAEPAGPPNQYWVNLKGMASGLAAKGGASYGYMGRRNDGGEYDGSGGFSAAQQASISSTIAGLFAGYKSIASNMGLKLPDLVSNTPGSASFTGSNGEMVGSRVGTSLADALTKSLDDLSMAIAMKMIPNLKSFQATGETLTATVQRLNQEFNLTNQITALSGKDGTAVFGKGNLKDRDQLVSMLGGLSNASSSVGSYYNAYHSQAERTADTRASIASTLRSLGIADAPTTRGQFRTLVESQDLATESGRRMYATLISVADAFAGITDAAANVSKALDPFDESRFKTLAAYRYANLRAGRVPAFAAGGSFDGGIRVVGESGPEVEFTGPSRIASNADSRRLLDNSQVVREVQLLRDDLRRGQLVMAQHLRVMSQVHKSWDGNGLPATRTV